MCTFCLTNEEAKICKQFVDQNDYIKVGKYKKIFSTQSVNKTIGQIIYEKRKAKRWTQKKLAERAGLSTTMISRIVNNKNSRNGEFNLEFDMIVRLSIGLEMGEKGLLLLLRAAYPTIFSALDNRETFLLFVSRLEDEKDRAEKAKK